MIENVKFNGVTKFEQTQLKLKAELIKKIKRKNQQQIQKCLATIKKENFKDLENL